MRIGLLASGNLGYTILKQINHSYELLFVMTDKSSHLIQDFCLTNNIPFFVGNQEMVIQTIF